MEMSTRLVEWQQRSSRGALCRALAVEGDVSALVALDTTGLS